MLTKQLICWSTTSTNQVISVLDVEESWIFDVVVIGRRCRRHLRRGVAGGEAPIEVEFGEIIFEVENLPSLFLFVLPDFGLEVVFEQDEALGGREVSVHVHEVPELQNACFVFARKAPLRREKDILC